MNKYIDAEGLESALRDWAEDAHEQNTFLDENDLVNLIHSEPTADVEPVVHAHWVEMPPNYCYSIFPYKCSSCGFLVGYESRYCPDCGAKMDEEQEK